jgi:hypothetical protein
LPRSPSFGFEKWTKERAEAKAAKEAEAAKAEEPTPADEAEEITEESPAEPKPRATRTRKTAAA